MKEADVLARFAAYLDREGWEVPLTPRGDSPDVDARHRETGRRLVAEVKGHTAEPGLDTDTAYGQLLRRMGTEPEPATRYALAAPCGQRLRRADAAEPGERRCRCSAGHAPGRHRDRAASGHQFLPWIVLGIAERAAGRFADVDSEQVIARLQMHDQLSDEN